MTEFSKQNRLREPLLWVLTITILFGVPIGVKIFFKANIGIFPLILIIIAVGGSNFLYRHLGERFPWLNFISGIPAFILAAFTLIGILITPVSAFVFWFRSFRNGVPDGELSNIFVMLITLFSAIAAPMMRKMGVVWPILVLSIAFSYLLAVIVQAVIVLIILAVLLAVTSIYYVIRRSKGSTRSMNAIFASVLFAVTSIAAGLFPDFDKAGGDTFVNDTVHPALRKLVARVLPRFSLLYAVPGYGTGFSESNLGERPNLTDTQLFEVEGRPGERLYLRTRSFDSYDGSSWTMSSRSVFFDLDRQDGGSFISMVQRQEGQVNTLTVTSRSFAYIPYTLDTKRVFFEGKIPPFKNGNITAGYWLTGPLPQGTKVYLERYPEEAKRYNRLGSASRESYLQLPKDLPLELRAIADGISRGTDSKAEILAKIEAFLAYNYTYTLDVPAHMEEEMGPGSRDFAYSFLFRDSGGYCVHFATSFILLARLAGIPARYATGYLTAIPPGEKKSMVTGLSSHAWPEVWLDEYGWINWEATPAANAANYTALGDEWIFNLDISLDRTTTEQLEGLLGRTISEREGLAGDNDRSFPVSLFLVILGSVSGAAVLSVISVRFAYPALKYATDKKGRFYRGMRLLSNRLERKGVRKPAKVGWLAWASDVKNLIGTDGGPGGRRIDDMMRVLLGFTYGEEDFPADTNSRFDEFRKHVCTELKNHKGRQDY